MVTEKNLASFACFRFDVERIVVQLLGKYISENFRSKQMIKRSGSHDCYFPSKGKTNFKTFVTKDVVYSSDEIVFF